MNVNSPDQPLHAFLIGPANVCLTAASDLAEGKGREHYYTHKKEKEIHIIKQKKQKIHKRVKIVQTSIKIKRMIKTKKKKTLPKLEQIQELLSILRVQDSCNVFPFLFVV